MYYASQQDNDYIQHYGVIGMKWGVRRNASRAYVKSLRKKDKMKAKEAKYNVKSIKYEGKALRKKAFATSGKAIQKAYELEAEANRYKFKSAKLKQKGEAWERHMRKTFSDYEIKRVPGKRVLVATGFTARFMDAYELTPLAELNKE